MDGRLKILLSALVFLGLCSAAFFLVPSSSGAGIWSGCQVLLVDGKIPEQDVLESLKSAGIFNVASESRQQVHISDFSHIVQVSLPEARQRLSALNQGDPRLDFFIRGLGLWYSAKVGGSSYRVYYIKDEFSSGSAHIASALKAYEGSFILPEAGTQEQNWCLWLGIVLAGFYAGYLVLSGRRFWVLRIFLLLPWPLLSFRTSADAGLALLWEALIGASLPVLQESYEGCLRSKSLRPLLKKGIEVLSASSPLLVSAFGFFVLEPGLLLSGFCGLCASLCGFWLALLVQSRIKTRLGFIPLQMASTSPLRRARSSIATLQTTYALLAACAGLLVSLFPCLFPPQNAQALPASISLPQPVAVKGRTSSEPGPKEAALLVKTRLPDFLPDMADYLAHEARQESVFYAPIGADTDLFSSLSIPTPEGGTSFSLSFDSSWARGAYRRAPENGIERLLMSQGSFVRAAVLPLSTFKAQPLAPREVILYIILVAPLLLSLVLGQAIRRSSGRREIMQSL